MSGWPGVNWVWLAAVDSTNAMAERLQEAWLADAEAVLPPTLICADTQWAGRGRHGRSWQSPRGGLYASFVSWVGVEALPWLPLAAGVAVLLGVRRLLPFLGRVLKWPNDLEVEQRKLGGVLCSSRIQGDRAWAVAGFGVNVLGAPALPGDPRQATSLAQLGFGGSLEEAREAILETFVTQFPVLLANPESLRRTWLAASIHGPGDRLRLKTTTGSVEGQFLGLSPQGMLELRAGDRIISLASGEVE
ncbi:MAG: biotin--[acetyl-CoA-carboxylase] ligase [Thermoanaerobaculum sp.]|nr:biotin--[acetyl-CoA-carboxylase] ligase [Thermoanaerobaculum sp.]